MFKAFKRLWNLGPRMSPPAPTTPLSGLSPDLQVATTVLLIEITRADLRVIGVERELLEKAVQKAFVLPNEEARQRIQAAEEVISDPKAVEDLCGRMNTSFSTEQKRYCLELLWGVALGDARLEKHEDFLVRKIARMLSLHHLDIIDAKLKAESISARRHRDS